MNFNLTHRNLFLYDAIGALLSSIFLGIVLVLLEEYIRMPRQILFLLSIIAFGFFIYSLGSHIVKPKKWKPLLRTIAIFNSLYCGLTLYFLIGQYSTLTNLGIAYFVIEIIIILNLVRIEWNVSK